MQLREIVFESIHHHQTPKVPYSLGFEGGTDLELDAYYGNTAWREKLAKYFVTVAAVETDIRVRIDEGHELDGYGGIWRVDRSIWHLEKPPLAKPSFKGYNFPT